MWNKLYKKALELHKNSGSIEVLVDLSTEKTVRLSELCPDWWGSERFEQ